jgi:GNAT superfamily N-acetyltransferase
LQDPLDAPWIATVSIVLRTPGSDELESLAATVGAWQRDGGPIHLHPGDLGWYSMRGPEATARALRAWSRDGELLALGLLDGPDGLLRLAVDPDVRNDELIARQLCSDITDPARGVLPDGEAIVEGRGAAALERMMLSKGWELGEPWTPLHHDLSDPVPDTLVTKAGLRVEVIGPDRADTWMEVHWSAFKGTPFGEAERRDVVDRWSTMMDGPFAERGRSLAVLDPGGRAVAIAGVWSAGRGRPGLIEPMGVHRDHRGKGYGAAVCEAAASALRQMGSSSAIVCAETSNVGAVSTYTAAGFTAHPPVPDLLRQC